MKRLVFLFITVIICFGGSAQVPNMAVFFNNTAVDSMGNYTFNTGGVSYSTTYYK